ncbi:MAG: peptidase S41, partial [Prevotella sp.]|nr:peptidase S41 [Prevotella sp.]
MKKLFLLVLTCVMSLSVVAQEHPLWLRFSAISPDGKTIAFSYKGDIYTVPSTGGEARQLTTNSAYDAYPVWSPDGNSIAFASTREGSFDVYLMSRNGGTPTRLTTSSNDELPITFSDNEHVLYKAKVMPTAQSIMPTRNFPQVYEVSTKGGRARLFSVITMEDISINSRGDILYHDYKGYEDPFRKHHQSAVTRDIWLTSNGKYTKLTDFRGEDRTPVWAADGQSFYYLSERDGTFNVWKRNVDGSGEQQLTHHKLTPVRYLTVANNGTLCYGYDGELYTWANGEEKKVNVTINTDRTDRDLVREVETTGATEICLSPKGK